LAIKYAIDNGRRSVTLVHKGNIMKYTEGAFRDWGYEVAKEEFADKTVTEDELWSEYGGEQPEGTVVIKDRIADNMFQQLLTRTDEYDVLAMPNLNGDYMSDFAAGLVLSGALMFEYLGWKEGSEIIKKAVEMTVKSGVVTYDIHRHVGGKLVGTKEFAEAVIENVQSL